MVPNPQIPRRNPPVVRQDEMVRSAFEFTKLRLYLQSTRPRVRLQMGCNHGDRRLSIFINGHNAIARFNVDHGLGRTVRHQDLAVRKDAEHARRIALASPRHVHRDRRDSLAARPCFDPVSPPPDFAAIEDKVMHRRPGDNVVDELGDG